MTVVGVICEYNPFHSGHAYHLSKIRRDFGKDALIVSFMSGNFTQRGEPAFLDKYARAEIAVKAGVNLVLEIPFPYSSSSAETFAKAGVRLAGIIGADVLSFGCECGDTDKLLRVCSNMQTEAYKKALKESIRNEVSVGHAAQTATVYEKFFGKDDSDVFSSPNNILALEYLRALFGTDIRPHAVRREGEGYASEKLSLGSFPSASGVREAFLRGTDVSAFVPAACAEVMEREKTSGKTAPSLDRVSSALFTSLMINSPGSPAFAEGEGGLYKRLQNTVPEAENYSALCKKSATKKYTDSRIRRAILFSHFGVTSSDLKTPVAFTHLLGADTRGLSLIKRVKCQSDFPIITKPSRQDGLSDTACRQKELTDRADVLFGLSFPSPSAPANVWRKTPFIEK